jgi:hypothetical protein
VLPSLNFGERTVRAAILTIRKEPYYRRAAFESMLKKHGYSVINHYGGSVPRSREDLLVLWNKKRGADEEAANAWEKRGGVVLVVENGYLQKVDKTYYAISVHGHNGSGWFPVGGEDRFTKLGFELKDWHEHKVGAHGTHTLICAQRGIGSTLMASPPGWAERLKVKLSHGKVLLRPHPGNSAPRIPLEHDLANAHACHIWSSGAGVRALVEGVPVTHHAPYWICDRPANRINQLHRMSHGQWHFDEIASGEPLARILDQLGNATWPPRA